MIKVTVHDNAKNDMRSLFHSGIPGEKELVAHVDVIVCAMRDDPDFQDTLLSQDSFYECSEIELSVKQWSEQQRRRNRNLWRLKLFEAKTGLTIPVRIIYAYTPPEGPFEAEFHVLGVLKRDWSKESFTYDESDDLTQRIINDYDELI